MAKTMDQIGADDISVGQVWLHITTERSNRFRWTVINIVKDRVKLERDETQVSVSMGGLLSNYVLVAD